MSCTRCRRYGTPQPCGACRQRESIDARIRDLDSQLTQATVERTKINAEMNEIHDPLYRLPFEIVSQIFEFGYASDTFHHPEQTPLVLGAVCRFWRSIAWSTPRIWTYVLFCINPPNLEGLLPTRLVLLDEYIKRTRVLPLSIRVYADEEYEFDEDEGDIENLVNILRYCAGRWSYLDLQLPAKFISSSDIGWLPRGGSILKYLALTIIECPGDDDPPSINFTRITSKLETLNLIDSAFNLNLLKVDYSHLKHVYASGSAEVSINLISSAPQLEEFVLFEEPGKHEWTPPLGPITHGSLKSLKITLLSFSQMLNILLRYLICPNLQTLSIDHPHRNSYRLEGLLHLLGHRSRSLRTLELRRLAASDSELKDFLVALPHLENLTIQKPESFSATSLFNIVFHEFLSSFEPVAQARPILPNLTTFCYDGPWFTDDSWSFLCHPTNSPVADVNALPLVTHRQPKLRKIEVDVQHDDDEDLTKDDTFLDQELLDVVQALQKLGVEISLRVFGTNFNIEDLVEESIEELTRIRTIAAWDNIFKKRPGMGPALEVQK